MATAYVVELLDVRLELESEAFRSLKYLPRLLKGERAFLAKDVAKERRTAMKLGRDEPLPRLRKHRVADHVYVFL